jgi:hypothetical protein
MKVLPASTSVTIAAEASRSRSASSIAEQMLSLRASQVEQGSIAPPASMMSGRGRTVIDLAAETALSLFTLCNSLEDKFYSPFGGKIKQIGFEPWPTVPCV